MSTIMAAGWRRLSFLFALSLTAPAPVLAIDDIFDLIAAPTEGQVTAGPREEPPRSLPPQPAEDVFCLLGGEARGDARPVPLPLPPVVADERELDAIASAFAAQAACSQPLSPARDVTPRGPVARCVSIDGDDPSDFASLYLRPEVGPEFAPPLEEYDPIEDPLSQQRLAMLPAPGDESGVRDSEKNQRKAPTLPPIQTVAIDLAPVTQKIDDEDSSAELPRDIAAERFGGYSSAAYGGNEMSRFAAIDYLWASPAMRHKPLYFEQPNLERYGSHVGGNFVASVGSTARFVAGAVLLPYRMGAQPPRECVYTLGVYRPGGCNPHFLHLSRVSPRGLLAQGAAVTGVVFLFP